MQRVKKHAHAMEETSEPLAQYKVCECSSSQRTQLGKRSLREGGAQTHCQTLPATCRPARLRLAVCPSLSLPLPIVLFIFFLRLKGRGESHLLLLPPFLARDATSSSIPDSICTDLQRAAFIIESRGVGVGGGGMVEGVSQHIVSV